MFFSFILAKNYTVGQEFLYIYFLDILKKLWNKKQILAKMPKNVRGTTSEPFWCKMSSAGLEKY